MDLFGDDSESWRKHWRGMPAFEQRDKMPIKQLVVNFESLDDVNAFATLVGQTITAKTKSIWFPESEKLVVADKVWVDKT